MNRKDRSEQLKVEKADLRKAKIDLGIMRYQLGSAKTAPPANKPTKIRL